MLLKSVAIWAHRLDRRSIYQWHQSEIAPPTVFSHRVYHPFRGSGAGRGDGTGGSGSNNYLATGSLVPVRYGGHENFYGNALTQTIDDDVEPYYYHGERILKQYLVAEKPKHDEARLDQHFGNPFQPYTMVERRRLPFGGIVDVPVLVNNDLEPKLHPFKPTSLLKNHGPFALGSGSLGYITLANGNVYLGSGSLGYLSQRQHVDTLTRPQQRPILIPGPLHFGSNDA